MKTSGIGKRARSKVAPRRRRRGATVMQVGGIIVVVVLALFFITSIRPFVKSKSSDSDKGIDAAIYSATEHERDPELHQLAMRRQWGSKELTKTQIVNSRVVVRQHNRNTISPRRRSTWVASRTINRRSPVVPPSLVEKRLIALPTVSQLPSLPKTPKTRITSISAPNLSPPTKIAASKSIPGSSQTIRELQPFHTVVVGPAVRMALQVGANRGYSVDCPSDSQNQMEVKVDGNTLEYSVEHGDNEQKEMTAKVVNGVLYVSGSNGPAAIITTPTLNNLEVSGDSTVRCTGIADRAFRVIESGHSTVEIDGQAPNLNVDLSGNSVLRGNNLTAKRMQAGISGDSAMDFGGEFSHLILNAEAGSSLRAHGHVARLELTGSSGSQVDCSGLMAENVAAEASAGAVMKVYAAKSLRASATASSQIEYSGNPKKINAMPDDTSRIHL